MEKILCVVTSNNVKGSTGIPTGFWLSELTHPMARSLRTRALKPSLRRLKAAKRRLIL